MIDQATLLAAALEGLTAQHAKIEEQIAAVRGMLGGGKKQGRKPKAAAPAEEAAAVPANKKRKKRVLSPEARERIAAAQKRRWATARGEA